LNANDTVIPVFTCYGSGGNTAASVLANTVFSGSQLC
jgi:hypothetical protein